MLPDKRRCHSEHENEVERRQPLYSFEDIRPSAKRADFCMDGGKTGEFASAFTVSRNRGIILPLMKVRAVACHFKVGHNPRRMRAARAIWLG